jgi:predicted acetyltransferase
VTSQPDHVNAAHVPLDPRSTEALAARELEYRVVPIDGDELDGYRNAVGRGFLGERSTPEVAQGWRDSLGSSRLVGVYDPRGAEPGVPVGTVNAWVMNVTADTDSFLPMWSISAVTVPSTHRRRGIARALLEGELRAAHDAGVPIAGLTVSEATIYGRYGFGVAAHTGSWTIDARRAGWVGPRPEGRLDHIEREALQHDLATLNATTYGRRPGDIEGWPRLWAELSGLTPGKPDPKVRAVRYTDAQGEVRGVLAYTVNENEQDFTRSTLNVITALADGRDAYAALWRYVLEHDLIGTVTASLRALDEPLRWMISDQRALTVTERDHHWLRILDVARCLSARGYRVPGSVTFAVSDDLEIADGVWRLEVDASGSGVVEKVDGGATAGAEAHVSLGISELSSLLLGGVSASTLLAAARIDTDADTARWLDLTFAPVSAPVLSFWY